MSWPRTRADVFGCFLEKTFGVRDERFNCLLKGYVNKGDPCRSADAYYEGPRFPAAKADRIAPEVASVELAWEHGELQAVSLTLTRKMTARRVRKLLRLPSKTDGIPKNVMNVDIQDCGKTATCVIIRGFEHLGAGDVDCGAQ